MERTTDSSQAGNATAVAPQFRMVEEEPAADSRQTRLRWTAWLLCLMVASVLLYAVDILFHPVSAAASAWFARFESCAILFGAATLCVTRGLASRGERSVWWLFAIALTLYGGGQAFYNIAYWTSAVVPIPSVADGLWLGFYLPAYAALYMLLRKRTGALGRGVWLDAAVGGLGIAGAAAALVFGILLESTSGTAAATVTNLSYPVGDLGLLALVGAAITIVGWRASGTWRLILGAFTLFAVADSIYLLQIAQGTFVPGGLVGLGWPLAALLVGVAAWRAESRSLVPRVSRSSIVIPAVFGFAALALLLIDHFAKLNPVALGLAAASIFVMLVRLNLAVRDNSRLLVHSRHEAKTDALTGLGNRRQLTADLAAHLVYLDPARPLMLTLFDLDGFKTYNDSFGHPAGDRLLERLGGRLSALLIGGGTAMGGDEFCALWNLSDIGEASTTTIEALDALSEHGEGFSISCSYGSVLLPNETTDPTEAIQMADRRMYRRKRGGRSSAGQQISDVLQQALAERDPGLRRHVDGVAALSCATARMLALSDEDIELVRQTAMLHDVGKVAIPAHILDKAGPLDVPEQAFIATHTIIGQRVISAAPALLPIGRLVRSTHERYDGSGYPDQLAGDAIPLVARIVSAADAYNAMTSTRPYQVAHNSHWAIGELRRCAGTQFDPVVVEALVAALSPDKKSAEPVPLALTA